MARQQALQHPLAHPQDISSRPLVVRELELTRRPRYQRHPLDSTEHRKVWIRLERRDTGRLTMAVLVVPHTTACKVTLVTVLGVAVVAPPAGCRMRVALVSHLNCTLRRQWGHLRGRLPRHKKWTALAEVVLVVPHTTACKVALVAVIGVSVVARPVGWRMRLVLGSVLRVVLARLHMAPQPRRPLQRCL